MGAARPRIDDPVLAPELGGKLRGQTPTFLTPKLFIKLDPDGGGEVFRILVINPGSTSTKTAVYEDEHCRWETVLVHPDDELASFSPVTAQLDYRLFRLLAALKDNGFELEGFAGVVARGGLLRPLAGGVYLVDREMENDLAANRFGEHASNLGTIMARRLAARAGLLAFTVDPVSMDELDGVARFSGLKGLPRVSLSYALNSKAVAREVSARLGRDYTDVNLVVVHLGSGISVSAHRGGRMVDVNNASSEGPFSLERCGTLPALALIELCCSRQCRRRRNGRIGHPQGRALLLSRHQGVAPGGGNGGGRRRRGGRGGCRDGLPGVQGNRGHGDGAGRSGRPRSPDRRHGPLSLDYGAHRGTSLVYRPGEGSAG